MQDLIHEQIWLDFYGQRLILRHEPKITGSDGKFMSTCKMNNTLRILQNFKRHWSLIEGF